MTPSPPQQTLPPQDVRNWLKAATQSVHEDLHQQPLLLAIQQGKIDLTGYQQVLGSFLATFTYVQQACDSTRRQGLTDLPAILDLDQHIALLQADLQHCHAHLNASKDSQDPQARSGGMPPKNLPSTLSKFAIQALWQQVQQHTFTPWLLGHYYVLHGSRFGRDTLAKGTTHLFAQPEQPEQPAPHIESKPTSTPDSTNSALTDSITQEAKQAGRCYVTLPSNAEPCSWPLFCDTLNHYITTANERQACHAGATLAFKLIETLLNLNCKPRHDSHTGDQQAKAV